MDVKHVHKVLASLPSTPPCRGGAKKIAIKETK